MSRTITVKGVGTVTAAPDLIELSLRLDAKHKDYEKAATLASDQLEALRAAVEGVGFEKDSLKTTNFHIFTEYETVPDKNGNYHTVFAGYHCEHNIKLSFDFDQARLSQTISAISSCDIQPELNIAFTVKEPAAVSEALLRSAAENARKKAEILCAASGAKLGELITIDYSWRDINLISPTRYGMADCANGAPKMARAAFAADITPDDISVNDSATFVWELI